MRPFYIVLLSLFINVLAAQQTPTFVSTSTATIGLSAISVNSIVAKTYRFTYPFYKYGIDSASGLFFFSGRQKTDGGNLYLNKSFAGCIDMQRDSVNWLLESVLYEPLLAAGSFYFSNDARTTRFNKFHGFDEPRYSSRLLYLLPGVNKGFTYQKTGSDVLSCISLADASVSWSATIPANENWVDIKPVNESLLLIAAGGLHGIDPGSGMRWSYPLITASKVTRALTYSLVNNNPSIRGISYVVETSGDENSVTELSSNILADNGTVYFAGKEKLLAVNTDGKLLWELDLKEYPVSKMLLVKKDASLLLVNFGLAKYADHYVIYGSPFALSIDPESGKVKTYSKLSSIENLVDFVIRDKSLVFAGKNAVLELKEGSDEVETILSLDVGKYGSFAEFINGGRYYTEKESFFVPLNFLNDKLIYFRADNNKIYGFDKNSLTYEYHLTDIYRLDKKFDDRLLVTGEKKSLLISSNFDLLGTFDTGDKPLVAGDHIFFIGEQQIQSVDLKGLK